MPEKDMEFLDVYYPTGNASTTYILKPPIPGFAETVENEAFCVMLAFLMDASVPEETIQSGRDRLYNKASASRSMHHFPPHHGQEDFYVHDVLFRTCQEVIG